MTGKRPLFDPNTGLYLGKGALLGSTALTPPAKLATPRKPRIFELIVNVSARLEGGINDWPSNIQDGVFAALERKSHELKLSLALTDCQCEHDIDQGWYIRVYASEVIVEIDRGRHRD